jgi:hypothetical protein
MTLDPRLASVELLTLAALRAKRHQVEAPGEAVVWIPYDGYDEAPLAGGAGCLYLSEKAPSIEAWASSPLIAGMRAHLTSPEAGHGA